MSHAISGTLKENKIITKCHETQSKVSPDASGKITDHKRTATKGYQTCPQVSPDISGTITSNISTTKNHQSHVFF